MRYGYLFGTRGGGEGRSVGHNGGAPGISADFSFYPETGYTIAILSNYDMGAMQVSRFVKSLINR
jgi:CubicO group peptidase (beta-lactamase class C family)